ncbi:MAG TPA: A24 family peptidase [Candidatus Nanoarchaeia archaeon]|nr:A24 family peptidase [Candidatus Nanoarchaeia archaeon]
MVYNWLATNFMPALITFALSLIVLLIGSITDLKTREVPDWVNYGLISAGIGLNLLFTVIYQTPSFIINSLVGLIIFFGIAYLMFYMGQWGGGDSKMIMGLGAAIGINVGSFSSEFLFGFLINALFAGAIYGLLWSFYLAYKNRQKFRKEFKKVLSQEKSEKIKWIILALTILSVIVFFIIKINYIKILVLSFAFMVLTTFYLWAFVRAIEKSSMYKLVEPSKLTEGDWIVKDIYYRKEYITGPKDLGIEKKQIIKLIELYSKKKVGKILIKEGIPFVPSFLIAFIITFFLGNPMMWIV